MERWSFDHAHRPRTGSLSSQVIGAGLFLAFVWLVIVYGYTA